MILTTALALFAMPETNAQSGEVKVFDILSDLQTKALPQGNALILGRSTVGDGNGGFFRWSATSTASTNLTVLVSSRNASTTGRWIQVGLDADNAPATQTLAAGTATVATTGRVIRVAGTGGATTITVNPAITVTGLRDGQELEIWGTSDTDTVVYTDEGGDAGIKLQLGAATRTLGIGDVLVLRYNTTDALWYELSFTNN